MNGPGPKALSSVYGKIEEILYTHPGTVRSPHDLPRLFSGVRHALPPDVRYTILAPYEPEGFNPLFGHEVHECVRELSTAELEHAGCPTRGVRIIVYRNDEDELYLGQWVQDYLYVLNDAGQVTLLTALDTRPKRNDGNHFINSFLSAVAGYSSRSFRYTFEGGDILIGDSYALLGKTLIERNKGRYPGTSREVLSRALASEVREHFGIGNIVWIDPDILNSGRRFRSAAPGLIVQQLPHHLDYYLTLGGRDSGGRELIFVGEIHESYCLGSDVRHPHIRAMRDSLDAVAQRLREGIEDGPRFTVERIPLIVDTREGGGCVLRPYNNCLIEVYGKRKQVYLPYYRRSEGNIRNVFDKAEEHGKARFQAHGFTVIFVHEDFMLRTNSKGSLHCMSKVLRRSAYEQAGSTESPQARDAIRVFIGYSHRDSDYMEADGVYGYLRGLEHYGFRFWDDRKLGIGQQWDSVIQEEIKQADIALFLISQHFLDSDYCRNTEIRRSLERARERKLVIVPILLSACEWQHHQWLADTHFLPTDNQTVREHFRSKGAFGALMQRIRGDIRQIGEGIRARRGA